MVQESTTSISPRLPSIRPTSRTSKVSPAQLATGPSSGQARAETQCGWTSKSPLPPAEEELMTNYIEFPNKTDGCLWCSTLVAVANNMRYNSKLYECSFKGYKIGDESYQWFARCWPPSPMPLQCIFHWRSSKQGTNSDHKVIPGSPGLLH